MKLRGVAVRDMNVFILAGGEGKRMGLLCQSRPKPVLPFAGKYRVIDFTLNNCVRSSIKEVNVLTDYRRSQMSEYLAQWQQSNSRAMKVKALEPRYGSYEGTADAVYQNLKNVPKNGPDTVLVLAGDHVYNMDYRKMLELHHTIKADITVGVVRVPLEQARHFGIVDTDGDSRIIAFEEKSLTPKNDLASMGIYIFNRNLLLELLHKDSLNPESRHDFGYSILPGAVRTHRAYAYQLNGYWQDIGTIDTYYRANLELIQGSSDLNLSGLLTARTGDRDTLPCVGENAVVNNSVIGPGCVVHGHVENSVLSPRVWIDERAEVRDSIIMGDSFIGPHTIVDNCIIDENVNIAGFCYIGFGPKLFPKECDITVVGRGVSIPGHTAIGRGCRISPRVSASDFVNGTISRGTIIPKPTEVVFKEE